YRPYWNDRARELSEKLWLPNVTDYVDLTTNERELYEDILAINTVFICRMQGRRAAQHRKKGKKRIRISTIRKAKKRKMDEEFHSSVFIDKKLYFSGGFSSVSNITNEFFYLDFSKQFTTTNIASIPWIDLTNTNGPLKHSATACIGGNNNDTIFIFGGFPYNNFVNQFNINKQKWNNISSTGSAPIYRKDISCAKFNNGFIAIFSGFINITYTTNDLWIFNTLTLSWSLSNATNAPPSRFGYCAITLPDANLVNNYMLVAFGAFQNSTFSSKIFMLNINKSASYTWTTEFILDTSQAISDSQMSDLMIGAIVSSVVSLVIIVSASIFLYFKADSFNVYNYLPITNMEFLHYRWNSTDE
ncbi:5651_t:CDS:2, partial [Scutellospora calospora]